MALVGSQLGQTIVSGGRDPLVLAAGGGSLLLLAGMVQTPGVSQFFGCTPLDPAAWAIACGSAVAATGLSVVGSLVLAEIERRAVLALPAPSEGDSPGRPVVEADDRLLRPAFGATGQAS